MTIILYGIPNCDTIKKARLWLESQEIAYTFHNFKKQGLTTQLVTTWLRDIAWDTLINRQGTTWRNLPLSRRDTIKDAASATPVMLELPTIIKRPVLFTGKHTYVGFSDALYQQIFNQ